MSMDHEAAQLSGTSRSLTRPWAFALIAAAALAAVPSAAHAQRRVPRVDAVRSTTANAQVKGIWEPVNYDEDLTLESVYFVTPDIGFASGQAGTIIKTVDGGAHWTVQLGGDPQGTGERIRDLRFVDQNHGFAVQSTGVGDHALLRTTDGTHWRASGTIAQHRGEYAFVSPTVGFVTSRNGIDRTRDAGRSWQRVMNCAAKVDVDGLSRNVSCELESISFPTARVGYAIGNSGDVHGVFIAKTSDGGDTWSVWRVLDSESGHQGFTTFTDANTGFLCVYGGRFYSTDDGGRTWDGVAGVDCGGGAKGRFADPETGWTLQTRRWNYTTDGGKSWGSRAMSFPAAVHGFSVPRRDRGYAVGDHGMVYRYRIVPSGYDAPNAIPAPAVGVFTSPLADQVEQLASDVELFSPDTTAEASFDAGSGAASQGGSASATGTARSRKGKGGGNTLGKVQALLDAVGATMPNFLARYRNLNLLYEGAQTGAGMPAWLQSVREGLAAFRSSTDKSSAAAALARLVSAADSLKTQTQVAFLQGSFAPGNDELPAFTPTSASAATDSSTAKGARKDATSAAKKEAADAVKKGIGGLLKRPFGHPR